MFCGCLEEFPVAAPTWGVLGPSWLQLRGPWGHLGSNLGGLGGFLAPTWGGLGPSWLQDGTKNQKSRENLIRRTPWAPLLGAILEPKINQNRAQERSERWSFLGSIWRSILGAIWSQLGPILASQTFPKLRQVGYKIDPSWGVDLRAVFW